MKSFEMVYVAQPLACSILIISPWSCLVTEKYQEMKLQAELETSVS